MLVWGVLGDAEIIADAILIIIVTITVITAVTTAATMILARKKREDVIAKAIAMDAEMLLVAGAMKITATMIAIVK